MMTFAEKMENAKRKREQARSARERQLIDLVIRNLEYRQRKGE